jgi:hypothetical protein
LDLKTASGWIWWTGYLDGKAGKFLGYMGSVGEYWPASEWDRR